MKRLIGAITVIIGVLIMQALYAMSPPATDFGNNLAGNIWPSPQIKEGKFDAPAVELDMSMSEFLAGIWDYFSNANRGKPETDLPVKPVDLGPFTDSHNKQLNVTWLGHSSLMINMDGYRLLTDPVFAKRVSLMGPTRFNGEVPLEINHIPSIDAVIISHDHYDHLNHYSIQQLSPKTQRFIVPLAVGARLIKWGVPADKIVELEWWQEYRFDANLTIAATPAQHFSGRGLTDRNRTLWASWVVISPHHKIFFSGDSGYFGGFRQIGQKYGPFDMTFIECGAYNASWSQVHMFPEQTVQAHLDLGGNVLHPIHWGTFNLALHPWYEPMERLVAAARSADVPIATPVAGDTTVFNSSLPDFAWWRQAMTTQQQLIREN